LEPNALSMAVNHQVSRVQRSPKSRARAGEFLERVQSDLGRPVPSTKICLFPAPPNHRYTRRHPVPLKGAFRDRHGRRARDAVDAAASGVRMGPQGGLIPVSGRPSRRTNGACGGRRSRVVLASVADAKSRGVLRTPNRAFRKTLIRGMTVAKGIRHRGERAISR
jgi:hypothetical protein